MHRWILTTLIATVVVTGASAERSYTAARVDGQPPAIDGDISGDAAWEAAAFAGDFSILGEADTAPTQGTRVKVLASDDWLYVGFVCAEPRIDEIVTEVEERDGATYQDDCVEVFLAPFADRNRYYHFVVNAAGVLRDESVKEAEWNSGARSAAELGEDYWSAELAVPIGDLGLDETVREVWGANFCRERRTEPELSCWAPCDSTFHEPENFGELTELNIPLTPHVLKTLKGKVRSLREALGQLRDAGDEYSELAEGRVLMGACLGEVEKLEDVEGKLRDATSLSQARSYGRTLAEVESAVSGLSRRAKKLPMLRAAGDKSYLVCSESTMVKVRPDEPYAAKAAESIEIYLGRNEYEARQIVVVPLREALEQVRVSVNELHGPEGAAIDVDSVSVQRVGYVEVERKSGRSPLEAGVYPDPLLDNEPTDIAKDRVQSWWITVHAGEELRAGTYEGSIMVDPENGEETLVPLGVTVWDFTLPTRSHLRTSYGINMNYVLSHYDIAAGPGRPVDWHAGSWTGADMQGIANYFGSMEYEIGFDHETYHSGERSVRVNVKNVEKGSQEWPRFCYYTDPLELEADTDYVFTVWYRTAEGNQDGPAGYFGAAGGVRWPATDGEWQQARYEFNTGDREGIRVYLRVDRVGTVWFDEARLAKKGAADGENVLSNPDFEEGEVGARDRIYDAYVLNSIRHRASPTNLIAPDITDHPDGSVSIDWTEFDERMQRYIDAGLTAFNVRWCRLPSGWGEVEEVTDEKRIRRARELLQKTQSHLEEKGWTDLAYIYTIDEPGASSFPQVKQAFDLAHDAAPKLRTLLTYGYGASKPIEPGAPRYAELAGYVDIHVPHSDCYEPEYLKRRQEMGDEIWAYVCISAQRPYLNNWGIDFPGMDHRLLFWQLFAHDISGFLYWQITYWQVNPWEDTLTYPGGNGDGSLLYPGESGPVNSIRFELCRDGTEDYDMMVMLKEVTARLNAEGRNLSSDEYLQYADLTSSWTEYSEDPKALEQQRREIGERLEELTRLARE